MFTPYLGNKSRLHTCFFFFLKFWVQTLPTRRHESLPLLSSQVLKGAVESQGAQGSFMKLSDLRADLSVRAAQGQFLWD